MVGYPKRYVGVGSVNSFCGMIGGDSAYGRGLGVDRVMS